MRKGIHQESRTPSPRVVISHERRGCEVKFTKGLAFLPLILIPPRYAGSNDSLAFNPELSPQSLRSLAFVYYDRFFFFHKSDSAKEGPDSAPETVISPKAPQGDADTDTQSLNINDHAPCADLKTHTCVYGVWVAAPVVLMYSTASPEKGELKDLDPPSLTRAPPAVRVPVTGLNHS